jgi:hypothetical protein
MARKLFSRISVSLLTIFAVTGAIAADRISPAKPIAADYTKLPLSFEPNQGQTDRQVEFVAHGNGYRLFLSRGKAVLSLQHSTTTIHMKPAGANRFAQVEPLDKLPGKSNYFIGSVPGRWHTDIPNYAKVRYHDVYRGVDLLYYGNQRQLEYDFVVSPGADPGTISLDFDGVAKADLDRQGSFVMQTANNVMRWHKPVAYQEFKGNRKFVACDYVRRGGQRFGFRLAGYDKAKPLIIDPVLDYSTYLGGSGYDYASGVAVDPRGDVYVAGVTASQDFPTRDEFQNTFRNTNETAFVSKFDKRGRLVYSTYLGGSGAPGDGAFGIAVDAHGNAYVTGYTGSKDFPVKNALQQWLKGTFNAFVTKLDADGDVLVYSTFLGGSGQDTAYGIAVDCRDYAYITGVTSSIDFPTKDPFKGHLTNPNGNAFVSKLDPDGDSLVYSTYIGGNQYDRGTGIAVDNHDNAYITGFTRSSDFPTQNAFQDVNRASPNATAFVTKFDRTGKFLAYSTFLGGSNVDFAYAIALDAHENAYVTGGTESADFPTKKPFQSELKGFQNAFVTKLDVTGSALFYSTYLGGPGSGVADEGTGIAVDSHGDAFVTGNTSSSGFPTKNAFQNELKGYQNAFVTKLDAADCALVYSSYLGGGGEQGTGIGLDGNRNAYVTGLTSSTSFPVKNAFQKDLGGPQDAFLTKISAR